MTEQETKTFWDEFIEFWEELKELLYTDFHNSYLFLIENKNYFICTLILAILLQFTSISTLGASFDRYCNKTINTVRNGIRQVGGGGETPGQPTEQPTGQVLQYAEIKKQEEEQKQSEKDKKKQQELAKEKAQEKADYLEKKEKNDKFQKMTETEQQEYLDKKSKKFDEKSEKKQKAKDKAVAMETSKEAYDAAQKEKQAHEEESKANQQRISFFENIKNKFGKGSKWGGQYGALGPVFGNMEKIFDAVKTVFYVFAIILTIAGVLSIPVLIFLVITYMVFKFMLGKFTAL